MRLITVLSSLLLLVPLGGCPVSGPDGPKPLPSGSMTQGDLVPLQPETGLTSGERFSKALGLLEEGEARQARVELVAYLAEKPGTPRAKNLMEQIDTDPIELLGEKSFPYTMKSGDTISNVAKRYLGDALKFYALARYNAIERPKDISVGQTIKVPGEGPGSEVATADPAPPAPNGSGVTPVTPEKVEGDGDVTPTVGATDHSDDMGDDPPMTEASKPDQPEKPQDQQVSDLPPANGKADEKDDIFVVNSILLEGQDRHDQGDYVGAARKFEDGLRDYPDNPQFKKGAAVNYTKHAVELEGEGQYDEAAKFLGLASNHLPGDQEISSKRNQIARLQKADVLYQQGVELDRDGKPLEAYDKFDEANRFAPGHRGAAAERERLKPKVIETLHRSAQQDFRRQDLCAAIAAWDKILVIDSNDSSAQVYRGQALELQKRLEDLNPDAPGCS